MDTDSLTFRTDYWEDAGARAAFQAFGRDLFGLDLSRWEAAGYWDPAYRPFSLIDGAGSVIASVCLYDLPVVVGGVLHRVGQMSAVGTRPGWRRRGLARRLCREALAWSEAQGHAWCYLFSDDDARALYRGLGFVPLREQITTVALRERPRSCRGARRLDPQAPEDRALLHAHASQRVPVSNRLCAMSTPLAMFHALGPLSDALWWIEPLDLVVFARRRGTELTFFDVLGPSIPPLDVIYPFLADPSDTRVLLRFEPDRFGDLAALGQPDTEALEGNNLHVTPSFPWPEPVVFPITAQA